MSVGEKIQTHRKRLGLSQDELGQKLLVSRQTISLWEKDQTVPTIDNLIRLREIFGVSLDAILGFASEESQEEVLPKEEYRFKYSNDELNEIDRLQRKDLYKRPILVAVICAITVFLFVLSQAPNFAYGFLAGVFLMGEIVNIKGIRVYKKAWPNTARRIQEQTYEYKVFDEYLGVNIYHENDIVRQSKCYYKDIEKIIPFGKWLILQFGGQAFIIRKADLKEGSFFLSYAPQPEPQKPPMATPPKWRAISIILFVASLMSILGALLLVNAASTLNGLILENVWLFFTMTPIPIASIIFGFVARGKGYRCKKNIIAGFIMLALLCIYGSFAFIFAGV